MNRSASSEVPVDETRLHPAAWPLANLIAGCEQRFQRRSGPGGQHRNKVETGVFLRHLATGVEAQACERRSQADNLAVAVRRLRLKLAVECRAAWSGPSPLWRARCKSGRVVVSDQHEDFPALLATALDALAANDWQLRDAAEKLGCTASQLVKLLKREPPALSLLNHQREAHGEHRLT
ncbi:MAG: peptide chain release factor-like protein [Planctomycetales bacterium]|nr:peptide chain release factor-like protein [Planctomycetales bacterium]